MKNVDLFSGPGSDPKFLAARDIPELVRVRRECERLWQIHRPHATPNFVSEFSLHFDDKFWEMYLGARLALRYPDIQYPKSGPDFVFEGPPPVAVEATVASTGKGLDAVPELDDADDDDSEGLVPFDQCILRITEALYRKSRANAAEKEAEKGSYVVAINLPYPQAWLCGVPPMSALATLGAGGVTIDLSDGRLIVSANPAIKKLSGSPVSTTNFLSVEYKHISAIIVASVNPFSSAYEDPAIEVLHNPTASQKLPPGWVPFGTEYWLEGDQLKSKRRD